MALYIAMATFNLYRLMFPLAMIDLSHYSKDTYVKPLWKSATPMYLQVYLSTRPTFNVAFLEESFEENRDSRNVELLWDERVGENSPSFSKSFLVTVSDCIDATRDCNDKSLDAATKWLDEAEQQALERGEAGVLSVVSGAGQGIESTSILLTAYMTVTDKLQSLLRALRILSTVEKGQFSQDSTQELTRARATVKLSSHSPLWLALQRNSTLFAHVVLLNAEHGAANDWPPIGLNETKERFVSAGRSHRILLGSVKLLKWDSPSHVTPPSRILYHDLIYIVKHYILQKTDERPPWDMEYAKPENHAMYAQAQQMKQQGIGYPYWKPMVSIKYINDLVDYPIDLAHLSGMPLVQFRPSNQHPTGYTFTPSIHVDEIGLTSEKYIPMNETVTSLPLRISFDRSDIEHAFSTASATAGSISPARWRLLSHLSQAIESQKALGFDESDIDDVRRLIADTNGT